MSDMSKKPMAFPCEYNDGMFLRDYFAGQALAGALAANPPVSQCDAGDIASVCYGVADFMLKEREK